MATIGERMARRKAELGRKAAVTAGVLVYIGMLAYTLPHNWRILTAGLPAGAVWVAALGVAAAELSAAALPLALHYWTHEQAHRMAALAFYALDLALIVGNVILDAGAATGAALPAWLLAYGVYIVPAVPVFAGLGWSILFLLDPEHRDRQAAAELAAETRAQMRERIMQAASVAAIDDLVTAAARDLARAIVTDTIGAALPAAEPAGVEEPDLQGQPSRNGRKPAAAFQAAGVEERPKD